VIESLDELGEGWTTGDGRSAVGGGSLPGETLPTRLLVAPPGLNPEVFSAVLRRGRPAVVARIEHDRLVLDLRTVLPEEDSTLVTVLQCALQDLGAGGSPCVS
jgi:L-seryl-tRNA(Ser) seleniumtransferase